MLSSAICQTLAASCLLSKLSLSHVKLNDTNVADICTIIQKARLLVDLDISWNKLFNGGFKHIFHPVSKNKTKLEHLECRGNGLGGDELDDLLYCISRSLKFLDLSSNNLS